MSAMITSGDRKAAASGAPCVREVVRCSIFPLFLRWAGWDDYVGYSPERKAALLKRMLAPHNMAIRQLSQEEGISEGTLHKWRAEARGKGQLLPDADAGPEGWSSRDKFAAVLETAVLNEADLAEYCRKRGLYLAQIAAWRSACEQANDWDRASTARLGQATKEEKKRVKELERDLARKDRALAETAALLVLRKKAQAIWGGDEDA
jgi:transposase-like protein